VIYVIENNGYSMGTAIHRHTANHDKLTMRGEAYGIKSIEIDGLDIRNVYDKMKPSSTSAATCSGPASSTSRPTATRATRCPTRRSTAPRTRSTSSRSRTRSRTCSHLMMRTRAAGCLTEDEWKAMQKEIKDDRHGRARVRRERADPDPDPGRHDALMKNLSPSETYTHGAKNPLPGENLSPTGTADGAKNPLL
jgi:TPP-dependent pyruvate/acetoin dehydrogenase alpha subunit